MSNVHVHYRLRRGDFSLEVDFDLPLRGITGIYGASGAGKTSLLRCIAGLERPSSGELVVDGEAWESSSENICRAVYARDIGYVFQEPSLFAHLDVRRNIEYGLRRRRSRNAADFKKVIGMLGLEKHLQHRPDQLSGGEAQRVAIARALLCSPRFVLMDEPLASLDQARKEEILPFLDRLHVDADIPVIYVSHNIDEICRLCDNLVVMEGGKIVASGDLSSVLVAAGAAGLSGDQAGAVIHGSVQDYDEKDDLTCLRFAGGQLWVPGEAGRRGTELRLRIRASDVSLCRVRPQQSTILNIFPAVVESIRTDDSAAALVTVSLGEASILSRVTRRSVRELNLRQGDDVFAQIKSVAVRPPKT